MIQQFQQVFDALWGTVEGRGIVRQSKVAARDVVARLRDFEARQNSDPVSGGQASTDEPLFILSAGWRSGSTLLQRMVMAGKPDMLVWGEPYDRAQLFDRMMDQMRCFTPEWPWDSFTERVSRDRNLSNQWVANLYPEPANLKRAHRAFFDTLFAKPARQCGYDQWGVKEVRLGMQHAHYLRWLYPKAKFLLLYRHPLDAYRSYRQRRRWFRRWPEEPVLTPYRFGRNWAELTSDFLNGHEDAGALLLRYEDLDTPETAAHIERYLGWPVERPSNIDLVGSSRSSQGTIWTPTIEKLLLYVAVKGTRERAGYGTT